MLTLLVSLVASFLVVLLIYFIGGKISTKGEKTANKMMAYASGEKLSSEKIGINVENFFIYVVGFMLLDILAFVFVSFMAVSGVVPLLYLSVVFWISITFLWMVKTQISEAS